MPPELKPEAEQIIDEILSEGEAPSVEAEGEQPPAKPILKEEEWVVPGKYKTADDVRKNLPKQERYIKDLETKNKRLMSVALGVEIPAEEPQKPKTDFFANPEKSLQESEEGQKQYTEMQLALMRGEIIIESIQEEYPNFDIKMNEEKIKEELGKYHPTYIGKNSRRLLRETIEKLGGKKASRQDNVPAPFVEEGGAPGAVFKAGDPTDKIIESIVKAEVNKCDVFA